jgi:hypothetical protein
MSRKNQATVEQIESIVPDAVSEIVTTENVVTETAIESPTEDVVTEVAVESETEKYIIPIDGTGADEFIKSSGSVSKAIRILCASYTRGEVAKMLNKRYQHVRNVMITPLKKNG